jgi:hypothetical protein
VPFTVIDDPGVPEPGAKVPPAMLVLPIEPVPVSAPLLTRTKLDGEIAPLTTSVPPLTEVAPM